MASDNRKNVPAKWTLPEVVHPTKTRCLVIEIPDERFHVAAFRGAMLSLASAYKWQDDMAHTAREVALVWRDVLDAIVDCDGTPVPIKPHGMEIDDDMSGLRVDCDCNVWITCCDGSEKQLLTSDQVKALVNGQPGSGAEQPAPGGGEACYNGNLAAGSSWVLPTSVNSGDVITLSDVTGATRDNAYVYWYCPDGQLFFGGACVGDPVTSGGDLKPSAPHGSIILDINGTYYDLSAGPLTLPGGIVSQQATLVVNYPSGATCSGVLSFKVCVTNNQQADWSSTFNFNLNSYATLFNVADGTWTPGTGYVGVNAGGGNQSFVAMTLIPTSVYVKDMTMVYDCAGHAGGSQILAFYSGAGGYLGTPTQPTTGNGEIFQQNLNSTVNQPGLQVGSGSDAGPCTVHSLTVTGKGTKPTGWPA